MLRSLVGSEMCIRDRCDSYLFTLLLGRYKMPKIRKIIKKKKKNEAKEALAKAIGGEELEIAAKILGELRERNKRKRIIEDRS